MSMSASVISSSLRCISASSGRRRIISRSLRLNSSKDCCFLGYSVISFSIRSRVARASSKVFWDFALAILSLMKRMPGCWVKALIFQLLEDLHYWHLFDILFWTVDKVKQCIDEFKRTLWSFVLRHELFPPSEQRYSHECLGTPSTGD